MDYKVAYASGEELRKVMKELEKKVNELYKEGYNLQGGISISEEKYGFNGFYTACQAMSK